MTLTAAFDSFEDMIEFARKLAGDTAAAKAEREKKGPPTAEDILGLTQPPAAPSVQPPVYTAPVQPVPTVPVASVPQPAPIPPTTPVPTTVPTYTLEDLTKAAIPLMDSGKQPALLQLLKDFGVEALPLLGPEQFGAFATALRGLGAQI